MVMAEPMIFGVWQRNGRNLMRGGNASSSLDLHPRLRWDNDVSLSSPVVNGTWITVAAIKAMVAHGRSHDDIIRHNPELEPDDIRAALEYAAA